MTIKILVSYFMDSIVDSEGFSPAMFNLYLYEDMLEACVAEECDFHWWLEAKDSTMIWSDDLKTVQDIDVWINKLSPYVIEFHKDMKG